MYAMFHGDVVKFRSTVAHDGGHVGISVGTQNPAPDVSWRQIPVFFFNWSNALDPSQEHW
jgi:hypothetical protein